MKAGRPKRVRTTKRIRTTTPKSLRPLRGKPATIENEVEEETIEALDNQLTKQTKLKGKFKAELPKLKHVRKKKHPTDVFKITAWKSTIINMCSQGASKVEVLAALGLTNKMHNKLLQEAREEIPNHKTVRYAETIERGIELAEAWWVQAGREGLTLGRGFNSNLYFMNMKNRFDWGDNMKVDLGEDTLRTLQEGIVAIAKGGSAPVKAPRGRPRKKLIRELDI